MGEQRNRELIKSLFYIFTALSTLGPTNIRTTNYLLLLLLLKAGAPLQRNSPASVFARSFRDWLGFVMCTLCEGRVIASYEETWKCRKSWRNAPKNTIARLVAVGRGRAGNRKKRTFVQKITVVQPFRRSSGEVQHQSHSTHTHKRNHSPCILLIVEQHRTTSSTAKKTGEQ